METPKVFWSYIKNLRKDNQGVSDLKVDGKLVSEDKQKAEALNDQFRSVFTEEGTGQIPNLGRSPFPDITRLKYLLWGV